MSINVNQCQSMSSNGNQGQAMSINQGEAIKQYQSSNANQMSSQVNVKQCLK